MKKNIGAIDRVIRMALAGGLLYVGLVVYGGSTLGIGLAFISIIPLITAMVGNCPLYNLLGINTYQTNPNVHSK